MTSTTPLILSVTQAVYSRGGIEETRLEAKAKHTKKFRGQGQPFRRQTLSMPRLRTKDTAASVLKTEKKVFKKVFQATSNS